MDSLLSFPVGLFHPLQTCRFIPTLSEWPSSRQSLFYDIDVPRTIDRNPHGHVQLCVLSRAIACRTGRSVVGDRRDESVGRH